MQNNDNNDNNDADTDILTQEQQLQCQHYFTDAERTVINAIHPTWRRHCFDIILENKKSSQTSSYFRAYPFRYTYTLQEASIWTPPGATHTRLEFMMVAHPTGTTITSCQTIALHSTTGDRFLY